MSNLSYNGLGQRLSMDAAGVIATYVLDGDRPLTAESGGNTTFYLYGLGAIGEETSAWSYSLPDGTNTPRQLSDLSGDITLSARYTPWGDTLDSFGTGNFTFGYLGGVLDATTGLLYVGNGQYYDPATGRFLTRDANPNSTNPYVPWNPIGAILGPLAVVSLFYRHKKKGSKAGTFLALVLVLGSVGMTLAACQTTTSGYDVTVTPSPAQPNTYTITLTPTTVPGSTPAPTGTPIPTITITCTVTPVPTSTLLPPPANPTESQRIEYINSFGITLEGNWTGRYLLNLWEALFDHIGYINLKYWMGGQKATIKTAGGADCPVDENGKKREYCYYGETPSTTIYFYATNMVNPVVNMLHEMGHLVDNLWQDYFTSKLKKTTFTDVDGKYLAGWNTTSYSYASLPRAIVKSEALIASPAGGGDAWQQGGGTPHWEDWADIFSNSILLNINKSNSLGKQMDTFFREMESHVMGGVP
ncbi:MAG: hypothetical protein IPM31_16650 [Anaerolineae bacterium]|nr:hypothetical protein [Anaerolineae bacterium]